MSIELEHERRVSAEAAERQKALDARREVFGIATRVRHGPLSAAAKRVFILRLGELLSQHAWLPEQKTLLHSLQVHLFSNGKKAHKRQRKVAKWIIRDPSVAASAVATPADDHTPGPAPRKEGEPVSTLSTPSPAPRKVPFTSRSLLAALWGAVDEIEENDPPEAKQVLADLIVWLTARGASWGRAGRLAAVIEGLSEEVRNKLTALAKAAESGLGGEEYERLRESARTALDSELSRAHWEEACASVAKEKTAVRSPW